MLWAIWITETTTTIEEFATQEDAESWVRRTTSQQDDERHVWIRTTRGFTRLSSIDEFRIGRLAT